MGALDSNPAASHGAFPYFFSDVDGFNFTAIAGGGDLKIYYSSMSENYRIWCHCKRWDVDNYTLIVETFLKKPDVDILLSYTKPGATGELYNILGKPHFYDKTWRGENTIKVKPYDNGTSNLHNMRSEKVIYVKNLSISPVAGASGYMNVKIEGSISGTTL